MIPVSIRTYKGSVFANVLSVTGTLFDAMIKMIGVACAFGMIGEIGVLPGILVGLVILVLAVALGTLIRKAAWKLADLLVMFKIKRRLSLSKS